MKEDIEQSNLMCTFSIYLARSKLKLFVQTVSQDLLRDSFVMERRENGQIEHEVVIIKRDLEKAKGLSQQRKKSVLKRLS